MSNYDSERMELSTRDRVAIANYTEINEGRGTPNGGVYLDISHKSKDFIMQKIPSIYRKFLDAQMLDISKEAMEVAPTAHYSMGGIVISSQEHCTSIEGLYAAGEVASGLHGANRLGGNSLAEILIFGKRAGISSVKYSKQIKAQIRSERCIKNAHDNINKFLNEGRELAKPIQHYLTNVMWEHCGVIKDKNLLNSGLEKVIEIKGMMKDIDVRIDNMNCDDLIQIYDLESSVISAEATILSALYRQESRGSHQRSDFPEINTDENCNYHIKLNEQNYSCEISRKDITPLRKDLQNIINKATKVSDFKDKLLE